MDQLVDALGRGRPDSAAISAHIEEADSMSARQFHGLALGVARGFPLEADEYSVGREAIFGAVVVLGRGEARIVRSVGRRKAPDHVAIPRLQRRRDDSGIADQRSVAATRNL